MLSTAKSITPVAPPQPQSAISPEMVMEIISTALQYTLELGGETKHRVVDGELWVRIRFPRVEIVPVEDDEAVSFLIVPIIKESANTGGVIGTTVDTA